MPAGVIGLDSSVTTDGTPPQCPGRADLIFEAPAGGVHVPQDGFGGPATSAPATVRAEAVELPVLPADQLGLLPSGAVAGQSGQ